MSQNTPVGQAHIIPQARRGDLIIEQVADETLIYDTISHQAHCLTPLAAQVFALCDGHSTLSQVGTQLNTSEADVLRALAQLQNAQLLEARQPEAVLETLKRRTLLKKGAQVGAAAAGAVMVSSIVAPTAAQAASLADNGAPCTAGAQCKSGFCSGTSGSPGVCVGP